MPLQRKRRDRDAETEKHQDADELTKLQTIERQAFDREAGNQKGNDEEEPEPDGPRGPGWRQALIGAIAVALGLAVGAGAIALLRDDGGEEPKEGPKEVADQLAVQGPAIPPLVAGQPDPALGQPVPVVDGETLAGEAITTGGRARPLVLIFVSHWSELSQTEVPQLVGLAGQGVFADVEVIGVSTLVSSSRPNYPPSEWLRREGWPFPTLADTADGTAASVYGANDLPYFVFVDANGVLVGRASGLVSPEALTRTVDELSMLPAAPGAP